MTDEEKKAAEEKAAADDAAFNAKLNAAVSSHAKRLKAEFEKSLADAVAKLTPTKPDDKPADDKPAGGAKPDPEARAVIHDLEASNALRLNEETGAYELAVKRPRSKGARPEELTYDDLAAGLKDWSQTDDAREFLPAQQAQQPQAGRKPLGAATLRTPASNNASPRAQADDLTRLLNANGVTEASLFGDD
jgi:hypothetical protein